MTEKILSVIVPMYNAGNWIEQCLRSLILPPEAMQFLEVIVVNDGSVDGCEKTAERFAEEYGETFAVIYKENGGHGSAVNAGILACTGQYIRVLDADDWLLTAELEKLIGLLFRLKQPDLVVCGFQTYDIISKQTKDVCTEGIVYAGDEMHADLPCRCMDMGELMREWKKYRPVFTLHGMIYRTEFYRRYGGSLPEGVYYDDAYYITAAASHAEKICLLDQSLYVYRIGNSAQSVSAPNRELRIKEAEYVFFKLCETINEERGKAGQEYWMRKTVSFLSDCFVTCFLRFGDRKAGRHAAKRLFGKLKREYPVLSRAVYKKYRALSLMGYLHLNEKHFDRLLHMRR